MSNRLGRGVSLEYVAGVVLAAGLSGCCETSSETVMEEHEGVIASQPLLDIRMQHATDEARCEAGCRLLVEDETTRDVTLLQCSAMGVEVPEDTWSEDNTNVRIECTIEYTTGTFCTGRRPPGHHETAMQDGSLGSWLAVHAHLEQASVTAFEQLAGWLECRDAPADLVRRCREAAADELRHAAAMGALARRHGNTVAPVISDPPSEDMLAVAMHNAVEGCVREAFGAIVAAYQARCSDSRFRATFQEIADDELRHGQLAWDLHRWLMSRLGPKARAAIAAAQAFALKELASIAAKGARSTPDGLGWPSPARAASMARHFCELAPALAAAS